MTVLDRLKAIGYHIELGEGDKIRCQWQGTGEPDPAVVAPLLAELRQRKAEALAELRGGQADAMEDPWWMVPDAEPESTLGPIDVFDRSRWLPPGTIVCLPCLDHSSCWTAHRVGTPQPTGHGLSQWDAIMALDDLEARIDRDR